MHYLWLIIAIAFETIGTMALQASQQFSRIGPSALCVVTYAASFYFMALALKVMPVGIVYAIWSGLGIVLIAGFSWVVFGQKLDGPAVAGISLIMAGIVVIQLFSDASPH
ncbi:multidrug efflux SMR transporter [Salipiger sp. IMCC34102]|uniref:DMT family transporter n=1 Tax=Salipiger sp. IMCC34102 TaxID=2510647 RepID=UPI00101CDA3E|nr:multidrug efflux SMR transporter [Salipiger sp. IMCC34102]RYH03489.1 multidrug efflux SMR transporter [Salipiger sp. IMCC34102]